MERLSRGLLFNAQNMMLELRSSKALMDDILQDSRLRRLAFESLGGYFVLWAGRGD
jgi:hypothetical protein